MEAGGSSIESEHVSNVLVLCGNVCFPMRMSLWNSKISYVYEQSETFVSLYSVRIPNQASFLSEKSYSLPKYFPRIFPSQKALIPSVSDPRIPRIHVPFRNSVSPYSPFSVPRILFQFRKYISVAFQMGGYYFLKRNNFMLPSKGLIFSS
jgi:hypothetical protein